MRKNIDIWAFAGPYIYFSSAVPEAERGAEELETEVGLK